MPSFENTFFDGKGFSKNFASGRTNAYKFRSKYSRKKMLIKISFLWEDCRSVSTAPTLF